MKNLFKNKAFIGSTAAVLVIIIVITVVFLRPDKNSIDIASHPPETSDVTVDVPDISTPSETSAVSEQPNKETEKENTSDLVVNVGNTKETDKNSDNSGKASTPDKPVTEEQPKSTENSNNNGGIQIGGGDSTEKYSCGCPNHHCINAENHAYITNLELEGCPYCGSHSCPSFYAVSAAGIPICDPSLCPKYDITKDPIKYCQKCHKKNGDGSNGTCVKFVNACYCPNCGEYVEANTCHTCK